MLLRPGSVESGWAKLMQKENRQKQPSWRDEITSSRRRTRKRSEDCKNGHALLPRAEQVEQAEVAPDGWIDELGRATVEMVLRLSAERIVGLRYLRHLPKVWHFATLGENFPTHRNYTVSTAI